MKTALVTGDLGFVGRHMVPALEARGYAVTGLDIKRGPHEDVRDWFRTSDERYDLVVHLAAVVGGRLTIDGAPLSVAVDLAIDAEFFGWAVRVGQPRVVYYSSSAAYPVDLQWRHIAHPYLHEDDLTWGEEDTVDERGPGSIGVPDMTYGWAKLTGEYLARFAADQGVIVHIMRPFSGYGEDQDLDYPFPSFAARARRRDDPFEVWGDGTQSRDFIHIDDVVEGTLAAVEKDYRAPLNLGTGRAVTFNELARMFMIEAGYTGIIRNLPAKPTGVHHRVAYVGNSLPIHRPRITLEEGIRRSLA